ncbi:SGNH/GDSL hydrolase family protein [Modestobacter sp. NPDC049651]|uniref:SGNH/GDSL hydrolase family protein n=1 Tax=unclassified Modestobacter TaxID=2643866 RepID=UPI0033F1395E
MSSSPRRLAVLAAAVLTPLVVGLAGCSGGDDDGGGGDSSAGQTRQSSGAAARSSGIEAGGTYLALGDSVVFGYRGGEQLSAYSDDDSFVGYPQLVGERLGLDVVNASCPGETTASFADPAAPNLGCTNSPGSAFGFRTAFPLHVGYSSRQQSQLDFALDRLRQDPEVALVTLQLGANDAFLCQRSTPDSCVAEAGQVAATVSANVGGILGRLRGEGGYDGRVAVVTYYALDYSDTALAAATQTLDEGIAQAARDNDATVVDGFAAFRDAAEQAGGSSTAAGLVRPGDVHPTEQGQQLLADAVAEAVQG